MFYAMSTSCHMHCAWMLPYYTQSVETSQVFDQNTMRSQDQGSLYSHFPLGVWEALSFVPVPVSVVDLGSHWEVACWTQGVPCLQTTASLGAGRRKPHRRRSAQACSWAAKFYQRGGIGPPDRKLLWEMLLLVHKIALWLFLFSQVMCYDEQTNLYLRTASLCLPKTSLSPLF